MAKDEMKNRIAELEHELAEAYNKVDAYDCVIRYLKNTLKMYESEKEVNQSESFTLRSDKGSWEKFLMEKAREESRTAEICAHVVERILRYAVRAAE